jgi:putative transposase
MKMPWKAAEAIEISEKERKILEKQASGSHTALSLKIRSEIILRASSGESTNEISKELGITRVTVRLWRKRYKSSYEQLQKVAEEQPHKLKHEIQKILRDDKRLGTPPIFTDKQKALIIALACQNPEDLNLPFSHWTNSLLQKEAIKQGIVDSISVSQVGQFLK